MITTKKLSFLLISLSLLSIVGLTVFKSIPKDQNTNLRKAYPLITESNYLIDDAALMFYDRVLLAPSIAKVKVVKQLPDYSVHIEDKEVGISSDVDFCQYQLMLISNITGEKIKTDDNGVFVITFAKELNSSYPTMKEGTTAICSLEPASGTHSGKYLIFDRTFYYVDDNMALAAYEGDDSPAKTMCKEIDLINRIDDIRSKKE